MKPYIKVLYNLIKFKALKFVCGKNITVHLFELLNYNLKLRMKRSSIIKFGKGVSNDGMLSITVDNNGILLIGDRVYFNENTIISVKSMVSIGQGCQFGPNVCIIDNNHMFDRLRGVSSNHITNPISIGDMSWIGANCVILKGSQIGKNCVIGAGCVITTNIPDGSIVTQNRQLNIKKIH